MKFKGLADNETLVSKADRNKYSETVLQSSRAYAIGHGSDYRFIGWAVETTKLSESKKLD